MARERRSSSMESGLEDIPLDILIRDFIQDREIDLHVALPAVVESYDGDTQTVDCTLQLNRAVPDSDGNWVPETSGLPKLADVPVVFPRCKRFSLTFPIAQGDTGLVVFCERNIGTWRRLNTRTDPGDVGLHTLDGAVFLPGLYADASPSQAAEDTALVIGSETNTSSQIEITDAEIRLGRAAVNKVGVAELIEAAFNALYTAVSGAVIVPGDGGAALKAAIVALKVPLPTAWPGELGSGTAKVKP